VRILHVVTLVSPDGAYGGPVRVAENQAAALRGLGHQVVVSAGRRGFRDAGPRALGEVPLRTFPAHQLVPGAGFSGLVAPGLQRFLHHELPRVDVVHVHLARDLIMLPAVRLARRRGVPYVLQTHGAIVESDHPLAGPLDRWATRGVLHDAAEVLYLTPEERVGLLAVARGPLPLSQLGNGVPLAADPPPPPVHPEVLFLARLAPRKRPALFARVARRLLEDGVDASFVLVGPDEGEGDLVRAEIAAVGDADRLRWEGPLDPGATSDRLARASLVVLPSVDEPYPMSVLEALAVGRPVVVTDSCGLAPAVAEEGCGRVVDSTEAGFEAAVRGWLADPAEQARTAEQALRAARERFSMDAVAATLAGVYAEAASASERAKLR
jgi:glycosyltransferase involved in cell wall biosynthesis